MSFYVIVYDDGRFECGEFPDCDSARIHAESNSHGSKFSLSAYESEVDYFAYL